MNNNLWQNTDEAEQTPIVFQDTLKTSYGLWPDLTHPVLVHQDLMEKLKEESGISRQTARRLTLLLQHLGAHGRTSVVKGCTGNGNNGWRRSPLGGSGGMQQYLWWTQSGSPPASHLNESGKSIYVRGIRHHDDHARLDCGGRDDYQSISSKDLNGDDPACESAFVPPWTDAQLEFARSEHPVRVLHGRPGTGKTAALWQSVNMRAGENVLYLTWNSSLAEKAGEYFRAFAPTDTRFTVWTLEQLVLEINGGSGQTTSPQKAEKDFYEAIGKLPNQPAGIWKRIPRVLFEELRAHYAVAGPLPDKEFLPLNGNLDPAQYRKARGAFLGHDCESLLKIAGILEKEGPLHRFFPDLEDVRQAFNAIFAMDTLPSSLEAIDRLVIDEAQDLTRLEIAFLCLLARKIAQSRDNMLPFMLFAGDESQTVRPTDFRWSSMKALLNDFLGTPPKEYFLEDNMRSPRDIGLLINHVEKLCSFDKEMKAKDSGSGAMPDDAVNARIVHCVANSGEELAETLRNLADNAEFTIIDPSGHFFLAESETSPSQLPEEVLSLIRSPAEVKGLDYQNACVLNPGRLLLKLSEELHERRRDKDFEQFWKRRLVDGFRVALSRATETLVALDIDATEEEIRASRRFLEEVEAVPMNTVELAEQIQMSDLSADERVRMMIQDALRNIDSNAVIAVRRARQATGSLGRADIPEGVSDVSLRQEAYLTLARTLLAQFNLDPGAPDVGEVLDEISELSQMAGIPGTAELFRGMRRHIRASNGARMPELFSIIDSLSSVEDEEWIKKGLIKQYSEWGKDMVAAMEDSRYAHEAAVKIEAFMLYLNSGKIPADKMSRINNWRLSAVETLVAAGNFQQGLEVAELLSPENPILRARCLEGLEHYEEAAAIYELEGDFEGACRSFRCIPSLDNAIRIMRQQGVSKEDLPALLWLKEQSDLAMKSPADLHSRLTVAEKKMMTGLLIRFCNQDGACS